MATRRSSAVKGAKPKTAKSSNPAKPAKRERIDWEAIERDYRTGKFTLRELEAKHGVDNAAIARRKKKAGWTQGLSAAVKQATNAKLIQQIVSKEVSEGQQNVSTAVLAAAEQNTQVILRHRTDIGRVRDVAFDLLSELALTTRSADAIEETFAKITAEMAGPQLASVQQQFRDFMRLHSRVGSAQKLADTLTKLQTLERKAFGLDDESEKDQPTELVDQMAEFFGQLHQSGAGRLPIAHRAKK
jgi:hypothetical protein